MKKSIPQLFIRIYESNPWLSFDSTGFDSREIEDTIAFANEFFADFHPIADISFKTSDHCMLLNMLATLYDKYSAWSNFAECTVGEHIQHYMNLLQTEQNNDLQKSDVLGKLCEGLNTVMDFVTKYDSIEEAT